MAKIKEIYKCDACGNVVEVYAGGDGELVCCDQPMKLMTASTEDKGMEKHVPVIEKTEKGYKVKVGEVEHPMTEEHYIQFIEFDCGCKSNVVKFLTPQDSPEAEFECSCDLKSVTAREHCNVHGLWKGTM